MIKNIQLKRKNFYIFLILFSFFNQSLIAQENDLINKDALPDLEVIDPRSTIKTTKANDALVLKEERLNVSSNDVDILSKEVKIIDRSDQLKNPSINNDQIQLEDDSKNLHNLSSTKDLSPILSFIVRKVRPFIDARVDYLLVKSGFESNIRKATDLEDQLKIKTTKENQSNSGLTATCGQDAEISFLIEDEYKTIIDDSRKDKKYWIRIGENDSYKGLELGLANMKVGETREILSPYSLNIGGFDKEMKLFLKRRPAIFKVALHDLREDEERDEMKRNLKFYDVVGSMSRKLTCTDYIYLEFKIFDIEGSLLYKSPKGKEISFSIGSGFNKYLEEILLGAKHGGKRIAFVRTKYLEDLKDIPGYKSIENIIKKHQAVILELSPRLQ